MAARRTASSSRSSKVKEIAAKRGAKTGTKRRAARKATARPTLAYVSAQLVALAAQVEALTALVGKLTLSHADGGPTPGPARRRKARLAHDDVDAQLDAAKKRSGARPTDDGVAFEPDLLKVLSLLDRRGRHAGVVPIPEVRNAFLDRGWTRQVFDRRLLQAERDFVVDLKSANDPARLAEPELAIEEPGRGHLQYVVLR